MLPELMPNYNLNNGDGHVHNEDGAISADDQQIINQARASSTHGTLFRHLWDGDIRDFDSTATAGRELC